MSFCSGRSERRSSANDDRGSPPETSTRLSRFRHLGSHEFAVTDFRRWMVTVWRAHALVPSATMKPVVEIQSFATRCDLSAARRPRLRTRLGGRLLIGIARLCLRLVKAIERTFGLPPEAAEAAWRRFATRAEGRLEGNSRPGSRPATDPFSS